MKARELEIIVMVDIEIEDDGIVKLDFGEWGVYHSGDVLMDLELMEELLKIMTNGN